MGPRFHAACLCAVFLTASATLHAGPLQVRPLPADTQQKPRLALERDGNLPPHTELLPLGEAGSPDLRVVRFAQGHRGLPVLGRGASVVVDPAGRLRFSVSRLVQSFPDDLSPKLTREQAAEVAERRTGLPVAPDRAALVLWPVGDRAELAFAVAPIPPLHVPYAPFVIVDADRGSVLHFEDLVRFHGAARVFPVNPVRTPQLSEVSLPVPESGEGTLLNDDVKVYNCVDQGTVRSTTLFGKDVDLHVCDLLQTATADPESGDFLHHDFEGHDVAEDRFAEVSAFYHANRGISFFRSLVPDIALRPLDEPLWVLANIRFPPGYSTFDVGTMGDASLPLDPFRNAAYYGTPYTKLLPMLPLRSVVFMGQGRWADSSYDGTVVYHELTHGVVRELGGLWWFHRDEQGMHCAPGAMEEGLADYFAAAISGHPEFASYFFTEFPDIELGRSVAQDRSCPAWLTGEGHTDSMVFSGALWETRSQLASDGDREVFDRAVLQAVAALPTPDVGFGEMADVLLATVESTSLGESGGALLDQALSRRGIRRGCERVLAWEGEPLRPPGVDVSGTYLSPGTSRDDQAFVPGFFQVRVDVPEDRGALRMSFWVTHFSADTKNMGLGKPEDETTPFSPAFLVHFDEPIAFFEEDGAWQHRADALVAAERKDDLCTADVSVPEGVTTAYVMVVNRGQRAARFVDVSFELLARAEAEAPRAETVVEAQGGCGCGTVDGGRRAGGAALILSAVTLAWRTRRRRRA